MVNITTGVIGTTVHGAINAYIGSVIDANYPPVHTTTEVAPELFPGATLHIQDVLGSYSVGYFPPIKPARNNGSMIMLPVTGHSVMKMFTASPMIRRTRPGIRALCNSCGGVYYR